MQRGDEIWTYSIVLIIQILFLILTLPSYVSAGEMVFNYTGDRQFFTVPDGVRRITVDAYGAQGASDYSCSGGRGGRVRKTIDVIPGEVLAVHVGGSGERQQKDWYYYSRYFKLQTTRSIGAYNGGGAGPQGGGGASDIRRGGDLEDRLVVAGGGGGCVGDTRFLRWANGYPVTNGGAGGGLVGGSGGSARSLAGYVSSAGGGSQNAGGIGGITTRGSRNYYSRLLAPLLGRGEAGVFGVGGAAESYRSFFVLRSGGGGGGWYGGGGGAAIGIPVFLILGYTYKIGGGGGGGSSYPPDAEHWQGVREGDGLVRITWSDYIENNSEMVDESSDDELIVTDNDVYVDPYIPSFTTYESCLVGNRYSISVVSYDPDNNGIRYHIDWGMNGVIDEIVPESGFVRSGVPYEVVNMFSSEGVYVVRIRAENEKGVYSPWRSFAFRCGEPGVESDIVIYDNGEVSDSDLSITVIPALFSPGQSVRVKWRAVDVVACTVRGSNGDGESGSVTGAWDMVVSSDLGEETSALFENTTYTMRCIDAYGMEHTRAADVRTVPTWEEK